MLSIRKNFLHTRSACYIGFVIQAIIINFAPLLFLIFENTYSIPLSQITLLVIINFACQFVIDILAATFASKMNYRVVIVGAHLLGAAGLLGLGFLPELTPDPFVGIVISILVGAIGAGLIDVIGNPLLQSCPNDGGFESMGLLHSFYCWGHLGTVLLSTLFLALAGKTNWQLLACLWALVPLLNAVYFMIVPINQPSEEAERQSSPKNIMKTGIFWLFVLIMMLGGSCEQGMAQWASAFAESALLDSNAIDPVLAKTVGDLMGPCLFAIMMGISRITYAKLCQKYDLRKMMILSGSLCIICYLVAALSQNPFLSLIGCGICGFSVGIMWPGTLDLAGISCSFGGTALFAMLALAGDMGCILGPSVIGVAADALGGGQLRTGMLIAALIPATLVIILIIFGINQKRKSLRKQAEDAQ